MTLFDRMQQVKDQAGEVPPSPAARPYIDLLVQFAANIERLYPQAVDATVRRTSLAGGWEVLLWPWKQPVQRLSLVAVYPDEDGVLVYNRVIADVDAFEEFLLVLWSSDTMREMIAGLCERSMQDVDGSVVRADAAGEPAERCQLVMHNGDFREMVVRAEGAEVQLRVRVGAHQLNPNGAMPAPEVALSANFAGHSLVDARLTVSTAADQAPWTHSLRGRRGPTLRRPYRTT
jgi:hypothetical protein